MSEGVSELERARAGYVPRLPVILQSGIAALEVEEGAATGAVRDAEAIRGHFPRTFGRPVVRFIRGSGARESRALRVGVVLSGGQAPGGHNVITGLFDALAQAHGDSKLFGFLGGPRGIFDERVEELTAERVGPYRNTGGFDLLGSGRDKIETDRQLADCRAACEKLALDGLVVVGGDDSNTNAAVLAEYFLKHGLPLSVVGVPKTIDGDLKGEQVEISFGFDTATKLYSELIGNICRDAKSAGKYWHFIKLMGRSASHVTLECALQTRANIALIGEEIEARGQTLQQVVDQIVEVIRRRTASGRHHGVCLVAEGLIEFIPEMRALIAELNRIVSAEDAAIDALGSQAEKAALLGQRLSPAGAQVFASLSDKIRRQLLLDRDSHGNVQVSKIDTEQLLIDGVKQRLERGSFQGRFQVQPHFLGYEGRCAAPSNFDADYTYSLGRLAAALIAFGKTGYICCVGNLVQDPQRWEALGVPLTSMMQLDQRKGKPTPVIGKALVQLDGAPFRKFAESREAWATDDRYRYPGPIQYFGPSDVSGRATRTLLLERGGA